MSKIQLAQDELDIVKDILQTYVPQAEIIVFGSRVSGTAKPYSDLDLVVKAQEKLPVSLYYQLINAFEESVLNIKVDLLDWYRMSAEFQQLVTNSKTALLKLQ